MQRVDVAVSDFADFVGGEDASSDFKSRRQDAFFEVKWCAKGWAPNSRELKSRRDSIPANVSKLAHHIDLGRCQVAAMVVFDDEGWFERQELALDGGWPASVWRLDVGPNPLRWLGLITAAEF